MGVSLRFPIRARTRQRSSFGGVHASVVAALVIFGLMVSMWVVSVVFTDASLVDLAWGVGFVVVAWAMRLTSEGDPALQNLLVALATVWGVRLSTYLAIRNLGHGEDRRYARMRRRWGSRFWLVSLFTVFLLQGAVMWVVSLPLQLGQSEPDAGIGLLAVVGAGVWSFGMFFEVVGDWQLRRFKNDPSNDGKILATGLWGWTRHPNYFGDACVWFGLALVASEIRGWAALISLISPIVMSFFLVGVSGKAMLERDLIRRRPDYAAYVASVPGFVPRPPRRTG